MIKDQIEADLKNSLRAKDSVQAGTLRMLKSRVKNEEIAKQKDFTDEELQIIVSSEIKKRKDSVQAFTAGGRNDLAEKEQAEMAFLQKYLPEQLSEAEVSAIIDEKMSGQTFTQKDFGKAMGLVMPSLKGKADGDLVSRLVKEKINS